MQDFLTAHLHAKPITIAAYYAIKSEPEIITALSILSASQQLLIALPCLSDDPQELVFRQYNHGEQLIIGSKFGIPQPSSHNPLIKPDKIDIFLIPCVAADKNFRRLGYGGGYYDRLINKLRSSCTNKQIFAGVLAERFLLDSLPREHHDAELDIIITERLVLENPGIG